ncbi:hypothetical protein [Rhodoplanes serenus]|uniref:hypothetical protein n=1 Tax=Rhodoplanes serenus TaxID=200615 RepID=UPI0011B93A82|nr:hypothetical protein [Rhodoplanes serenus]
MRVVSTRHRAGTSQQSTPFVLPPGAQSVYSLNMMRRAYPGFVLVTLLAVVTAGLGWALSAQELPTGITRTGMTIGVAAHHHVNTTAHHARHSHAGQTLSDRDESGTHSGDAQEHDREDGLQRSASAALSCHAAADAAGGCDPAAPHSTPNGPCCGAATCHATLPPVVPVTAMMLLTAAADPSPPDLGFEKSFAVRLDRPPRPTDC